MGVVMLFGVATLAAFAGLGVALLLNEGWEAKAVIMTGLFLFSALYTGIGAGRIIRTGEI